MAHSTNPRLALIYKHSDATTLKVIYGTAFRAPTPYELYYQDGGSTTKSNPDLHSEKIRTAELALEQRLSDATTFTVAGFYYKLDNLIEQYLDPADGLLVFRNDEGVIGKGAEAEITHQWPGGMTAMGSYSFTESAYEDAGYRPANSPRHLAKLLLMVPLIDNKLFAGLETLYRGDVRTLDGRTAGGFVVTNLTFTYDNVVKNLDAALSIYNLFDKHYGYPGGSEHTQDIIEQDGTSVSFRLTYRF
jgi:outer membrane receptor protein involved in Fe transport